MPIPTWTVYTAPADLVTPDLVRSFLDQQRQDRLFVESTTLELKRERHGDNVLKAIAGLANTSGGLVIVGVDEDDPTLDESPGVPPESVTAILGQCQAALTPVVEPEIIPVATGDPTRVVLVLRVVADPAMWPVVLRGRVYLRQTGQTVPATHNQILDLVARRTPTPNGASMVSVPSAFTPQPRGFGDSPGAADLWVRAASAVYSRTSGESQLLLGMSERAELGASVGSSALAALLQDHLPRRSRSRLTVLPFADDERTSRLYRAHTDVAVGDTTNRLAVEVRVSGPQVAFAVDYYGRLSQERDQPAQLERHELLVAVLCAIDTCRDAITPAVARWMGGAPAHVEDYYCWTQSPRGGPLAEAMSMTGVDRVSLADGALPWSPTQWMVEVPVTDNPEDTVGSIRDQLRSFYLDLGMDDERSVADTDLARALATRERLRSPA